MAEEAQELGLNLVFRVGARVCALPIANVLETMRPLPIDEMAGQPACVLGVSMVRGAAIPVIDAARLFGALTERTPPTRFVTIDAGGRRAALAVDAVVGVRALGELDSDLPLVVGSADIVPQSVWAAMATRTARES